MGYEKKFDASNLHKEDDMEDGGKFLGGPTLYCEQGLQSSLEIYSMSLLLMVG